MIVSEFEPVYDKNSKILILGSFPSVLSRENEFYYGNPRNRFWVLLSELLNQDKPESNEEKKDFLIRNKIALYDAAKSCKIEGSSDSSMTEIVPADLKPIFSAADIKKVFTNGNKAYEILKKMHGIDSHLLPSTSPANARYNLDMLKEKWSVVLNYL